MSYNYRQPRCLEILQSSKRIERSVRGRVLGAAAAVAAERADRAGAEREREGEPRGEHEPHRVVVARVLESRTLVNIDPGADEGHGMRTQPLCLSDVLAYPPKRTMASTQATRAVSVPSAAVSVIITVPMRWYVAPMRPKSVL
jgi:hypothetical protein